jgi:hypothetical protein
MHALEKIVVLVGRGRIGIGHRGVLMRPGRWYASRA